MLTHKDFASNMAVALIYRNPLVEETSISKSQKYMTAIRRRCWSHPSFSLLSQASKWQYCLSELTSFATIFLLLSLLPSLSLPKKTRSAVWSSWWSFAKQWLRGFLKHLLQQDFKIIDIFLRNNLLRLSCILLILLSHYEINLTIEKMCFYCQ